MGDLTYGTDAANMLFHVVNDRHRKKRAMVVTTNSLFRLGAESSRMTTSCKPFSIGSSSAGACLRWMGRRYAPNTSDLTINLTWNIRSTGQKRDVPERPGCDVSHASESSTSRTFRVNWTALNGLPKKGMFSSNTPCRTTTSSV